ncbi:hypothetical protein FA15DRAFT_633100 [Coprinopsis marcescibilis]|uniref:Nuclear segregation protein Bfr1 n=1 Tax=Coprinopsis marcescibilis TaxID=230819 RepID=A0A5C3L7X2_COPMA|nr:hypothetical protein FA15DRAFT_633100 [Coprinopsis marcescibilis]
MPAAKTKAAANTNGSAAPKPISRSGTATPVSTVGTKDAVEADATLTVGKPDKKAFDTEQESLKAELDAVQAKLNAVRDKISLATGSGVTNEKRNALRAELDDLKGNQALSKNSRTKVREQISAKQDIIAKKVKDLQAAKSKIPFKTVAEVDAHIKNLESQVESGNMKLADEKRALAEISTFKRNRRLVEGFQADQDTIDTERQALDELRKQLADPEFNALSERYDTIKKELDELKQAGDEAAAERNKLFQQRDSLQSEFKELLAKKRESSQRYRENNDRYWTKVNEDRARRVEKSRAQKIAEEQQKKKDLADLLLEEAKAPAFQAQIEDCQTLIDYLLGRTTGAVTFKTAAQPQDKTVVGVPKLEIRQVEDIPEGSILKKKKGEDQESYFVGGKGKGKGGKKVLAKDAPATSSNALNVPLPTLSALLALSIPPPVSSTDVPRVVEDLKTKKAWFEANQESTTKENIAKAQKEIERLTGASEAKPLAQDVDTSPSSLAEPGAEESTEEVKADS